MSETQKLTVQRDSKNNFKYKILQAVFSSSIKSIFNSNLTQKGISRGKEKQGEGMIEKKSQRKAKTVTWSLEMPRKIILSGHITDILLCIPLIYVKNSKVSL